MCAVKPVRFGCARLHRDVLNIELFWMLILGFQVCQVVILPLLWTTWYLEILNKWTSSLLSTWKCLGIEEGCLGKSDVVALLCKGRGILKLTQELSTSFELLPYKFFPFHSVPRLWWREKRTGLLYVNWGFLGGSRQVLLYSWSHFRSCWGSLLGRIKICLLVWLHSSNSEVLFVVFPWSSLKLICNVLRRA